MPTPAYCGGKNDSAAFSSYRRRQRPCSSSSQRRIRRTRQSSRKRDTGILIGPRTCSTTTLPSGTWAWKYLSRLALVLFALFFGRHGKLATFRLQPFPIIFALAVVEGTNNINNTRKQAQNKKQQQDRQKQTPTPSKTQDQKSHPNVTLETHDSTTSPKNATAKPQSSKPEKSSLKRILTTNGNDTLKTNMEDESSQSQPPQEMQHQLHTTTANATTNTKSTNGPKANTPPSLSYPTIQARNGVPPISTDGNNNKLLVDDDEHDNTEQQRLLLQKAMRKQQQQQEAHDTGEGKDDNDLEQQQEDPLQRLRQEISMQLEEQRRKEEAEKKKNARKQMEGDFLNWCRQVLGIYTVLEIATFEYYDYMGDMMQRYATNADEREDDDDYYSFFSTSSTSSSQLNNKTPIKADNNSAQTHKTKEIEPLQQQQLPEPLPMISVRGLAASRDIEAGETVISIPLQALVSVATTIDQDPVLSRVMGPDARRSKGWVANAHDEASYFLEMPLLAVALLHHRRLGPGSPLYMYLNILEDAASPSDTMPFLWTKDHLNDKRLVSEGIRTVAKGIQREIKDMYTTFVQVLIHDHPDVFGPAPTGEWMFSFEKFQWAFAMVNSRHWQLPIEDLEAHHNHRPDRQKQQKQQRKVGNQQKQRQGTMHRHQKIRLAQQQQQPQGSLDEQGLPPASTPTEEWVQEHDGDIDETTDDDDGGGGGDDAYDNDDVGELIMDGSDGARQTGATAVSHSFLAPVADLLNFGPPCTHGKYNKELRTFEIIASCSFHKGQEVTFWYTDECDDIMVGVYGFTHPIVPPCPTAEEYRARGEEYRYRAEELEEKLKEAYLDLDHLEFQFDYLQEILEGCGECCDKHHRQRQQQQQQNVDGPEANPPRQPPSTRLRHEQRVRGGQSRYNEYDSSSGSSSADSSRAGSGSNTQSGSSDAARQQGASHSPRRRRRSARSRRSEF